jgi:hypothetical protein
MTSDSLKMGAEIPPEMLCTPNIHQIMDNVLHRCNAINKQPLQTFREMLAVCFLFESVTLCVVSRISAGLQVISSGIMVYVHAAENHIHRNRDCVKRLCSRRPWLSLQYL